MRPSRLRRRSVAALLTGVMLLAAVTLLFGQNYGPPPSRPPREAFLKEIKDKIHRLGDAIDSLRKQGVKDPWLAELEIYHKAVVWILKHDEFYQPNAAEWTLEALDRGLVRARLAAQSDTPWVGERGHAVVRAYRSRIDGSVQPYAIVFPADYGRDPRKEWRLDIVLHGRDPGLSEVQFLHHFNGDKAAPRGQNFVELHIYGRGNNAYRWAGETDVFEAVNAFLAVERALGRGQFLDPSRVVLRGFSMGGAGAWHLGLHWPDRWCAIAPGAGFTTTRGYLSNLGQLTPAQEACLHIYDAVDYAANVVNVPVVAYAGEKDGQLQAARNIEARLKELQVPRDRMDLLIAPGLKHQFPPEWQAKVQKGLARFVAEGRKDYPRRVRFVTYTMKYASCYWVEVLGLDRHYERAEVDAEKTEAGYTIKTTNIRGLHVTLPNEGAPQEVKVTIDNQVLTARPWLNRNSTPHVYLQRRAGRWSAVLPQKLLTEQARGLRKTTNLQGPIDDAFMDSFLCVRGTGKPWHAATLKYTDTSLERFQQEWSKYLRGTLPVKDDVDVTDQDIAEKHLILFGDPGSNSLIAGVLDDLPLQWTRETVTVGSQKFDAAGHVPVLIYPSPLNAQRYVVLNSGHTFHAADFQGSNALLYPRLGDYAVLKLSPTAKDALHATIAISGLYDDYWRLKE